MAFFAALDSITLVRQQLRATSTHRRSYEKVKGVQDSPLDGGTTRGESQLCSDRSSVRGGSQKAANTLLRALVVRGCKMGRALWSFGGVVLFNRCTSHCTYLDCN